jgi:hypothetical protein
MPLIQFKGKTAIESYHHTIPHHTLEFDPKLSVLPKGEKPSLDGNLIIEGDNLLRLCALWTMLTLLQLTIVHILNYVSFIRAV